MTETSGVAVPKIGGERILGAFDRVDLFALALILAWGLFRLAPGLGHDRIWDWDESLHQVVTRHVYDQPLKPMLYDDPVHPLTDLKMWFVSNLWVHKPPGSFWFGALMMIFTGVSPLAFRIGGLLAQLIAGATIYFLGKSIAPRLGALIASIGYLSLSTGWTFTQARFVSDELDLMLAGCICVAMVCLFLAIERDSWKWACAAGAAAGAGYLCRSVLALTPLGVAGVLWALGRFRFCKGPRWQILLWFGAAALVVAAPWNLYAAFKWPQMYQRAFIYQLGFLSDSASEEGVASWRRPVDAIFNEINQSCYDPIPQIVVLVVGVALVLRAFRKRELVAVGAAIWLWSTWIGHSLAAVKVSSHVWNSVIAGFVGVAVVLEDIWESPGLALAIAAAVATPWLIKAFPSLQRLRELVPAKLEQTRRVPGLFEGLVAIPVTVGLGWAVSRIRPVSHRVPRWALALPPALALVWMILWTTTARQSEVSAEAEPENNLVYSREVGRAIDALTPRKSLLMLDIDYDLPHQLEHHNLMFWSDRLVHRSRDPEDYPQAGYHPYLVSPAAEPFSPLEGVPADAWLRAYDMERPMDRPPPLPAGARPVDIHWGNMHVLAYAAGRSDRTHDHYAFFVHSEGIPSALPVNFRMSKGVDAQLLQPEASLRGRGRLANVPWFILPAIGPPLAQVQAIDLGGGPDGRIVLAPAP